MEVASKLIVARVSEKSVLEFISELACSNPCRLDDFGLAKAFLSLSEYLRKHQVGVELLEMLKKFAFSVQKFLDGKEHKTSNVEPKQRAIFEKSTRPTVPSPIPPRKSLFAKNVPDLQDSACFSPFPYRPSSGGDSGIESMLDQARSLTVSPAFSPTSFRSKNPSNCSDDVDGSSPIPKKISTIRRSLLPQLDDAADMDNDDLPFVDRTEQPEVEVEQQLVEPHVQDTANQHFENVAFVEIEDKLDSSSPLLEDAATKGDNDMPHIGPTEQLKVDNEEELVEPDAQDIANISNDNMVTVAVIEVDEKVDNSALHLNDTVKTGDNDVPYIGPTEQVDIEIEEQVNELDAYDTADVANEHMEAVAIVELDEKVDSSLLQLNEAADTDNNNMPFVDRTKQLDAEVEQQLVEPDAQDIAKTANEHNGTVVVVEVDEKVENSPLHLDDAADTDDDNMPYVDLKEQPKIEIEKQIIESNVQDTTSQHAAKTVAFVEVEEKLDDSQIEHLTAVSATIVEVPEPAENGIAAPRQSKKIQKKDDSRPFEASAHEVGLMDKLIYLNNPERSIGAVMFLLLIIVVYS
uniref:Uncharacterized protein n=1 Tax=Plectus sambesii TaxID=2011161 RepID=A0A914UMZ0_9BILA